ncbi:type IV toxin-antitoxin system AbiEi family antitoxin domain-containing protein [Pengzhenrongella sp.]|jgi:predicted transcriptional regulator of viral defense system|uniref:type IV toxin-antitoxin system AbiEi family antitoxin domain-containing protein n=1 Tax=Pengzhenrongella sp. TaxID=2888820 RepID=UPI002F920444
MAGWDEVWEIAADQHGYVTVEQAGNAGINYEALKQAAWRGRVERPARGIYRLPTVPATAHDLEALAVLWTGDAAAALSHDSALAAYDLGDINPDKYHVTVPAARRIRKAGGDGYVIHHQDLRPEQVTWWEGIRTVTPLTAIEQTLVSGVPTYLLRQAITAAYKQARIRDADRRRLTAQLTRKAS